MARRLTVTLLVLLLAMSIVMVAAPGALSEGRFYWIRQTSGTADVLSSVDASDDDNAWAVGGNGTILHYDGTSWKKDPQSGVVTDQTLLSVSVLDRNHVWAVGWNLRRLFYDGTKWIDQSVDPGDRDLYGVDALDRQHVWAVGQSGTVQFFDGTSWSFQDDLGHGLYSVSAADENHVWATGPYGNIAFFDGSDWDWQDSGTTRDLVAVYALDATHVWAAGQDGIILFNDGTGWKQQMSGLGQYFTFRGIHAVDPSHVWVVGDTDGGGQGTIYFFDGTDWVKQDSGCDQHLFGVTAHDRLHAWASGEGGAMLFGTEPVIEACSPVAAHQGHVLDLAVKGSGTGFASGVSRVELSGTGTPVVKTIVYDATHAGATVTIGQGAPPGKRDVNVVTGSQVPDPLVGGFEVLPAPAGAPVLDLLEPDSGPPGARVTLSGRNFGDYQGSSSVLFNGVEADTDSWSDNAVTCEVPFGASSGPVVVVTPWGTSNSEHFEITATAYYFAEGTSRPGFETYFSIQNPTDAVAEVVIDYMRGDGTEQAQALTVGEYSRETVNAAVAMGIADDAAHDFSAKVESINGVPIVVERPMYFDYKGMWPGGTSSMGALAPGLEFFFAEGTTRPGFDTYFSLMNPSDDDAGLEITYMKGDGTTEQGQLTVPPHSRSTVVAEQVLGSADDPAHDFSTRIESSNGVGFVAERPMYFDYSGGRSGGTDTLGAFEPGERFYFAEGTTRPGYDSYIAIQNTGGADALVKVTYMKGNGATDEQHVSVSPMSRSTISVKDFLGTGDDPAHDFAAVVESTNGAQILVERPMYFDYKGMWPGGTDAVGERDPDLEFYFAEGTCRPGFESYLCVANPGLSPAEIKITYMLGDGQTKEQAVDVGPHSRATVSVNEILGEADDDAHDFSAKVESTNGVPVIAERPMYFNYKGMWPGGTNATGF